MGVTVKLPEPLASLEFTDRQLMHEIGLLARERIVRRTLRGTSVSGDAFTPYSPGYRAQKAKALGGSSTVNLQASGQMLNDIAVEATEDSVTLSFKT